MSERSHPQLHDDDEPEFYRTEYPVEDYRPEEWAQAVENAPNVRLSSITRELLVGGVPTSAVLCSIRSGSFSVEGYEFSLTRRGIYYDGQFFPSTQNDTIPLADIRSQLNVYERSGQKIMDMHFKAAELPKKELYESDDIALEVLLSTLTPIFRHLEHGSAGQPRLFE